MVTHQMNKGEAVSEDEYRTIDLCGDCVDELLDVFLAGKFQPQLMVKENYIGEDAAPSLYRDQPTLPNPIPAPADG